MDEGYYYLTTGEWGRLCRCNQDYPLITRNSWIGFRQFRAIYLCVGPWEIKLNVQKFLLNCRVEID